jgi:peptidoglycan hydrolase-like protein with peptidoglycan-binding domain
MVKRALAVIVVLGFIFSTMNISLAGKSAQQIEKYQNDLAKLGYYKGQPTGKMDEATMQAIKECQKRCGLEPTGKLDNKTCGAIDKLMEQQSASGVKGGEGEMGK